MSKFKVYFVAVMVLSALIYMFQYSSRTGQIYQPFLKYTPTDTPTDTPTGTPTDTPLHLPWTLKDVWNHLKPVYEPKKGKPPAVKSVNISTATAATKTQPKSAQTTKLNGNSTTSPSKETTGKKNATQAKPTATTGAQGTTSAKRNATQQSQSAKQSDAKPVTSINTKVAPTIAKAPPTLQNITSTIAKAPPTLQTTTPIITKVTPTLQTVTPTLPPTTTPKTTKYLCKNFIGRLGNHMYMFASAFGISRRHGMRLVIKPDSTIKAVFNVEGSYETNWDLCNGAKSTGENGCCRVSPNIYNISNDRSHVIGGYLQSYKYFDDYSDELRRLFTFREPVLKEAKSKLNKLLGGFYKGKDVSLRTLVGVHVRRGDYLSSNSIKFGYIVATPDYMHRAVKYMNEHFENVTYIVCSNDVKWTSETMKNETDVIIVPMGPAHVDMALLSLTDHMIMTVGTYGFWASWLVNGTVVYFRNFTNPNTPFGRNFDDGYHDTFPPNWIGL